MIYQLGSHSPLALKQNNIVAAGMAQPLQKQATSERSLDLWCPEIAVNAELAECIAFPEQHHLKDVVTSLEQEAFREGADFVGK